MQSIVLSNNVINYIAQKSENSFNLTEMFENQTVDGVKSLILETNPTQTWFYKNLIGSSLLDLINRDNEITTDNFASINKRNYLNVEKDLLDMINLSPDNFGTFYTSSGTDASDKIFKALTKDKSKTLFIKTTREHPCVFENFKRYAQYDATIDIDNIQIKDGKWIIVGTDWFNTITRLINENLNLENIVLTIIGTQSDTGDITPSSFIKELQTEIRKLTFDREIRLFSVIDAAQEIFTTNRDYSNFDIIFGSGFTVFSSKSLGFVIYKKQQDLINILTENKLISEDYLDIGHNPYTLPVLKSCLEQIKNIINTYPDFIYSCANKMNDFAKILEQEYNIKMQRVTFNPSFKQTSTIYSFTLEGIDLSCYFNNEDKLTFLRQTVYDGKQIVIFRISAYQLLMSEHRFSLILVWILKLIQDYNKNKDKRNKYFIDMN